MLHEILIRLWHNCEDVSKLYELQEFLHPGEKELVQHILEIGSKYHWIVSFCKAVQNFKDDKNSEETSAMSDAHLEGLYIKAFASGVMDVLGDYRSEIIKLEETFLQNPLLPLTLVFSSLQQYEVLFNMLKSVIDVLQKENLHGCLLMGRLHKYVYCGVDSIANAAERITHRLNGIFYRHLCNWIIYGDIVDNHSEFFICDGKCPDEDFLYPEQLEEASLSSSRISVDRVKNRIKRPPPVRKFYINWKMVPLFINQDTAESILFMGRIVWIVKNDPKKVTDDPYQTKYRRDVWDGKDLEYYKKIQALEKQTFDQVEFQRTVEECRIKLTKYLWAVMLGEGNLKQHLQLIRDYYALGRGELFHQFIQVAESHIKSTALEHNTYNLNFIFLETARKIYGENDKTYLRFELATSKTESKSNPWSKLQLNFEINWPLHIVFHPKAMELYNKLFCFLLRLSKTQIHLQKLWQSHMVGKQNIDRRVWTLRQHLTFLVNNLQYYLQVDVIEAQFSVLLKAVESANEFEDIIKLHHEFVSNLLAKTFVLTPDEGHTYQNKHHLHQMPAVQFNVPSKVKMALEASTASVVFLWHIPGWWFLVSGTCHRFLPFLKMSRETSSRQRRSNPEDVMMNFILFHSILLQVYNVILQLLELCDRFCVNASTWETELLEPEVVELEEFQKRTDVIVESLLFILYQLHGKAKGQHLLQLLYQLDFNRYFSRSKPDFNLTQSS